MAPTPEIFLLGRVTFLLVTTLLFLSWITVGLRLWVRLCITKSPGCDDAFMVLTLLLFTCYSSFILVIIFRISDGDLQASNIILEILTFVQLGEVFYILTTTMLKISLGLFFLRVIAERWQRRIFYSILSVSAVYGLVYVFIIIFQCGDPTKLADGLLRSRYCLPHKFILSAGYLYGAINVVADWTFVLIPIFVLLDSDMDRRSKISVSMVMALGAVGSIASILRMIYLEGLRFDASGLSPGAIKTTIWASAEPGTGIIASSIAILRPLVRKIATDVKHKVTEYSTARDSRMNIAQKPSDLGWKGNDSRIRLTLVANGGDNRDTRESKYSTRSDYEDPWSPTITLEQARIGRVVSIAMTTENQPKVSLKP